ncbi:MAG: imidazole glycerol phosphate synthase cyclase subunit, partial [Elusimicrobiota bacterium]
HYYENGADELLYMDIVASLYGRNNLLDMVRRTAREIFIPLTVGGGLRSLDDIREMLRAGADKVALNTAAVRRPELIREASRKFGSSTIVVSIEAIRHADGVYEAYTDNGREKTGLEAVAWAKKAAELGAGEILVTSIDREGTGEGFDLELTRMISRAVPLPVIACGGAGSVEHALSAAREGEAQAVCVASVLHYELLKNHPVEESFAEGVNTAHLRQGSGFGRIREASLPRLKAYLCENGVDCRHDPKVDAHA